HRAVGGLESNAIALMVEPLERRLLLRAEPDGNRLPVLAGLLMAQDDDVAVVDQRVDHRQALDPQRKETVRLAPEQVGADLDLLGRLIQDDVVEDRDRCTGGDLPNDGHPRDVARARAVYQLDAARNVPIAANEIALLQDIEVIIDHARRGHVKLALNFADRRW